MVKIVTVFLLALMLQGDVFERECVGCHNRLPVDIDKFFYRYLLEYSSEERVKQAIYSYLKAPSKEKSVMDAAFLARFGVKRALKLPPQSLKEAVDIYWERYKVFGRLQ